MKKSIKLIPIKQVFENIYQEDYTEHEALFTPLHEFIATCVIKRKELGLSQKDLATKMNTQQANISKFECMERFPTGRFMQNIAEALGPQILILFSDLEASAKGVNSERTLPFNCFIEECKKKRVALGISQKEIANKLKTCQSSISKVEQMNEPISYRFMAKMAWALHLRISFSFEKVSILGSIPSEKEIDSQKILYDWMDSENREEPSSLIPVGGFASPAYSYSINRGETQLSYSGDSASSSDSNNNNYRLAA